MECAVAAFLETLSTSCECQAGPMDFWALEEPEPSVKVRRSTARSPGRVQYHWHGAMATPYNTRLVPGHALSESSCRLFIDFVQLSRRLIFVAITVIVGRDCPHG
jgi:hypothetical protein